MKRGLCILAVTALTSLYGSAAVYAGELYKIRSYQPTSDQEEPAGMRVDTTRGTNGDVTANFTLTQGDQTLAEFQNFHLLSEFDRTRIFGVKSTSQLRPAFGELTVVFTGNDHDNGRTGILKIGNVEFQYEKVPMRDQSQDSSKNQ